MADEHPETGDEELRREVSALGHLVQVTNDRLSPLKDWVARRLEPYEHVPVVDVLVGAYRRDRESAGAVLGSAVAFRLFLFFVPLLLFVIGVAGLLSGLVSASDVNHVAGVSGDLASQVRDAFATHGQGRWFATLLGLIGMVTAGRSLSKVLYAVSGLAWRLPLAVKAPLKVVGAVAGLLFGMALVVVVVNRVRLDLGYGAAGISFAPALAVYVVAWLAISMLLPRGTDDPGALLPGAILVGLTITGMQAVSQFYLPGNLARAGELYGAVGTTVVTLGWFFILGRMVVVGMVLNSVIYERYGSVSTLLFSLPLLRILPRRSERLRRFFDLS